MKRIFFLILAVVAAQGGVAYAQTQTLTLSTYYPAPFGAYDRLRLVPREALTCDANTNGLIYYDNGVNNFVYCINGIKTTNIWARSGDNIFPTDTTTNPNLRVGIGTTAPDSRYVVTVNSPPGMAALLWAANNTAVGFLGVGPNGSDAYVGAFGGGPGNLTLRTGNANRLTILNNGNVGIGTTAPASLLSVNGGISAGAYAGNAAPANGMIISGNVGIGTTAPARNLDVIGNGRFSTGVSGGLFFMGSDTFANLNARPGPWIGMQTDNANGTQNWVGIRTGAGGALVVGNGPGSFADINVRNAVMSGIATSRQTLAADTPQTLVTKSYVDGKPIDWMEVLSAPITDVTGGINTVLCPVGWTRVGCGSFVSLDRQNRTGIEGVKVQFSGDQPYSFDPSGRGCSAVVDIGAGNPVIPYGPGNLYPDFPAPPLKPWHELKNHEKIYSWKNRATCIRIKP